MDPPGRLATTVMFFVALTVVLIVAGAASLVVAARHGRSWQTLLPLVTVAVLALFGAAWLLGAPALV